MAEKPIEINLYKDLVLGAVRLVYQRFRVALPGRVREYDRDTVQVGVDLVVRLLGTDRVPRDEPPVQETPVIMPRGGGYGMYFDLKEGDPTVLVCLDSPGWSFYQTGESTTPQDPTGHQYGTAVAFPGGWVSSSVPGQATPPPNPQGTILFGADDGSSSIICSGAGLPSPAELGSMVIATSGPTASLKLGSDQAILGVARLTDPVAAAPTWIAFASAVAGYINGLVPGTVVIPSPTDMGIISGASTKVTADD